MQNILNPLNEACNIYSNDLLTKNGMQSFRNIYPPENLIGWTWYPCQGRSLRRWSDKFLSCKYWRKTEERKSMRWTGYLSKKGLKIEKKNRYILSYGLLEKGQLCNTSTTQRIDFHQKCKHTTSFVYKDNTKNGWMKRILLISTNNQIRSR